MEQRIQKIIAEMGIASRRKAEELIIEGRVTLNGRVVELGTKADPTRDHIKVDGKLLTRPETKVYYIFHKPRGVVTSLSDPEGRPTVGDFLAGIRQRVFPVGRLDFDSEGMLLLTNDGEFAHGILHPSKKIPKTYVVKVKGVPDDEQIGRLRQGMKNDGVLTAPARVKRLRKGENNTWLEMTIHEGRKRQIRRMLERVGHPVLRLKRVRIDGVHMGELAPGAVRRMTPDELARMRQEIDRGDTR